MLVLDEFGKGYPVAHLITKREDTEVLTSFFTSIKERVVTIHFNTLMTDDDNAGWNAFTMVFGCPVRHLLCKWHLQG